MSLSGTYSTEIETYPHIRIHFTGIQSILIHNSPWLETEVHQELNEKPVWYTKQLEYYSDNEEGLVMRAATWVLLRGGCQAEKGACFTNLFIHI